MICLMKYFYFSFVSSSQLNVRDLLSWVKFMNATCPPLSPTESFYHGAHLVFLDSLGCNGYMTGVERKHVVQETQSFLKDLLQQSDLDDRCLSNVLSDADCFGIYPFFIEKGLKDCNRFFRNLSHFLFAYHGSAYILTSCLWQQSFFTS